MRSETKRSDAGDRRTVGDIPEKTFITEVLSRFAPTAVADQFEDCMILDVGRGDESRVATVLNVDHPSYTRSSLRDLDDYRFYGRWAAAGVCGDVISMGVRPQGFALDLSLPHTIEVCQVEAVMEGITQVLDRYGARLIGGNVDLSTLEIVGVAWGQAPLDQLVRRGGAEAGDIVVATCVLGVGWSAFLADEFNLLGSLPPALASVANDYKIETYAPIEPILEIANTGIWTSGMDLSDGPIEFLYTIAERNGLGVLVDEEALGHHPLIRAVAERLDVPASALALEPGYDFPFSHGYTAGAEDRGDIERVFARHGTTCLVLGEVTPGSRVELKRSDGSRWEIPRYWSDQADTKERRIQRWQQIASELAGSR
jgi:thiamine-monophosphate kinase